MNNTERRSVDNAEAASLQTYLMSNYPECRPAYPAGLFAWAQNALQYKAEADEALYAHVVCAEGKAKKRNAYMAMVLGMVKRHLMK